MPPAVAIAVVAVVAVVGGVMAASAAKQNAKAQRNAAEFNAAVDRRNAEAARSAARSDAELQRREGLRRIGAVRAAAGGSGVTQEGSVLDLVEESASNAELDNQTILHRGELKAIGLLDSANLNEAEGKQAIKVGNQQATAALLGSAGKAAGAYAGAG